MICLFTNSLVSCGAQVLLCRTRLRRGAQRNWVRSILYIPPERSTGEHASLGQVRQPGYWTEASTAGYSKVRPHRQQLLPNRNPQKWASTAIVLVPQVWWYVGGLCYGRLSVHSLATNITRPVQTSGNMPAVLAMAQVRTLWLKHVWLLHYIALPTHVPFALRLISGSRQNA